ncbi:U-box domain-containing protein 52-like [Phalaenopsis equestris]|uniref:U-box domain-containing protein 52-like n=1 Tax=Phalaenopsis equestris TaxID=78828 RepID=UPI0009E5CAB4|nr:U-box domain-containing protein 52-like [Phalaenopsis equestris]
MGDGRPALDTSIRLTAVAVHKDKNSQHAVKWAVENLMSTTTIVLIHVRNKSAKTEAGQETTREEADEEVNNLFLPYRGFSARKGMMVRMNLHAIYGGVAASKPSPGCAVYYTLSLCLHDCLCTLQTQLKEEVLEGADISNTIVDYINAKSIQNLVVGASNSSIMKKLRGVDVPYNLIKSVPDFCAVYVISKGKPTTIRPARNSYPSTIPPRNLSFMASSLYQPDQDNTVRAPYSRRNWGVSAPPTPIHERTERRSTDLLPDYLNTSARDRPLSTARSVPNNLFMDNLDPANQAQSSVDYGSSFSDDIDLQGVSFQSMNIGDSLEFSSASMDSHWTGSSSSFTGANRELESEMRKLKLELKQTIEMYSNACKEAVIAKQKTMELQQWKIEEAQKFEELRNAEEAALAMAEMEKIKRRSAVEAAEAAQRIAELEALKRQHAERKARREAEEKKKVLDALAHTDTRYRRYTIEEIKAATNDFSAENKIGEGGYGPVYKAYLDHTPVAIKVLRTDAAQGRKQFQQEVEVLSCIRHPNMVLLLGACPENGCLVYEFMDNGSLDDRLFRKGNSPPIPWSTRFKIAAEIATALLFLHQAKPEPLVHRDLKPANILLDRNYASKISDVGLARLVPPCEADNVTQYHMTSTAGTFCYIDPEYQQTGMLGVKSDIYSLGIMLLQIITAKPPMGLTHHVERAIEKGIFAKLLDPAITDWPVKETLCYAKIALKCAELRRKDRPDLGTVVLPELNRLRKFGREYEVSRRYNAKSCRSGSNFSTPPRPHSNSSSHPRTQPLVQQEKVISNASITAPWTSSSDDELRSG